MFLSQYNDKLNICGVLKTKRKKVITSQKHLAYKENTFAVAEFLLKRNKKKTIDAQSTGKPQKK